MPKVSFLNFMKEISKTSPLLKDFKVPLSKEEQTIPLILNFKEIEDFFKEHGRLPADDGDINERKLAVRLERYRANYRSNVEPYDYFGILNEPEKEVIPKASGNIINSLSDIFKSDKHGLLNDNSSSIFELKHVDTHKDETTRSMPDEIATRRPCQDFGLFEKTFIDIQDAIKTKDAKIIDFSSETQMSVGHFYVLNGVLCYVAEVLDERVEEVAHNAIERPNPRFRVIFENGVETNILKRSLARALYKDRHGRIVIPSGAEAPILSSEEDTSKLRETGCVYILSSETKAPALAEFKRRGVLHKIGFSTQDVMQRIRGAEKDPTYLEAPVKLEANIRCFNLDPHEMENLIHAFLANQKISMTLYTKSGKPYVPREWYNVDLETALEVARHIADGTIMEYRMDNTTNKIKRIKTD